jgi:hypothetical protein
MSEHIVEATPVTTVGETSPQHRACLEWVQVNYTDLTPDILDGAVEACMEFRAATGEFPLHQEALEAWLDGQTVKPNGTVQVEAAAVSDELAKAAALAQQEGEQAAREQREQVAGGELRKTAEAAGKCIKRAEIGVTAANVKGARMVRDGLRAYLAVFPSGEKAGRSIVAGKLSEVTAESYDVPKLLSWAGIADVFGDVAVKLTQRKYRELLKLVERVKTDANGEALWEVWTVLPGIDAESKALVAGGDAKPYDQFVADVLKLRGQSERFLAQQLKAAAEAKLVQAKAEQKQTGEHTQSSKLLVLAAQQEQAEALAAEQRAEQYSDKAERKEAVASGVKVDREITRLEQKGVQPAVERSEVAQVPASQAAAIGLAWFEEIARSKDTDLRIQLAIKLLGGDWELCSEVIGVSTGKWTPEQQASFAQDNLDEKGLVCLMGRLTDEGDIKAVVNGIRGNAGLRKAVGKTFGGNRIPAAAIDAAADAAVDA